MTKLSTVATAIRSKGHSRVRPPLGVGEEVIISRGILKGERGVIASISTGEREGLTRPGEIFLIEGTWYRPGSLKKLPRLRKKRNMKKKDTKTAFRVNDLVALETGEEARVRRINESSCWPYAVVFPSGAPFPMGKNDLKLLYRPDRFKVGDRVHVWIVDHTIFNVSGQIGVIIEYDEKKYAPFKIQFPTLDPIEAGVDEIDLVREDDRSDGTPALTLEQGDYIKSHESKTRQRGPLELPVKDYFREKVGAFCNENDLTFGRGHLDGEWESFHFRNRRSFLKALDFVVQETKMIKEGRLRDGLRMNHWVRILDKDSVFYQKIGYIKEIDGSKESPYCVCLDDSTNPLVAWFPSKWLEEGLGRSSTNPLLSGSPSSKWLEEVCRIRESQAVVESDQKAKTGFKFNDRVRILPQISAFYGRVGYIKGINDWSDFPYHVSFSSSVDPFEGEIAQFKGEELLLMKQELKLGDRVRVIDESDPEYGHVGKVDQINSDWDNYNYAVEFPDSYYYYNLDQLEEIIDNVPGEKLGEESVLPSRPRSGALLISQEFDSPNTVEQTVEIEDPAIEDPEDLKTLPPEDPTNIEEKPKVGDRVRVEIGNGSPFYKREGIVTNFLDENFCYIEFDLDQGRRGPFHFHLLKKIETVPESTEIKPKFKKGDLVEVIGDYMNGLHGVVESIRTYTEVGKIDYEVIETKDDGFYGKTHYFGGEELVLKTTPKFKKGDPVLIKAGHHLDVGKVGTIDGPRVVSRWPVRRQGGVGYILEQDLELTPEFKEWDLVRIIGGPSDHLGKVGLAEYHCSDGWYVTVQGAKDPRVISGRDLEFAKDLRVNDRVRVVSGSSAGRIGSIKSIEGDTKPYKVSLSKGILFNFDKEELTLDPGAFEIGNWVEVIDDKQFGGSIGYIDAIIQDRDQPYLVVFPCQGYARFGEEDLRLFQFPIKLYDWVKIKGSSDVYGYGIVLEIREKDDDPPYSVLLHHDGDPVKLHGHQLELISKAGSIPMISEDPLSEVARTLQAKELPLDIDPIVGGILIKSKELNLILQFKKVEGGYALSSHLVGSTEPPSIIGSFSGSLPNKNMTDLVVEVVERVLTSIRDQYNKKIGLLQDQRDLFSTWVEGMRR